MLGEDKLAGVRLRDKALAGGVERVGALGLGHVACSTKPLTPPTGSAQRRDALPLTGNVALAEAEAVGACLALEPVQTLAEQAQLLCQDLVLVDEPRDHQGEVQEQEQN